MGRVELSELARIEEAVTDLRFETCRNWSRTRLLCNPVDARTLCHAVRNRTRLAHWSDENILLTLFPAKQRPRRRT